MANTPRPRPLMYVDKGIGNKLEGNFNLQHLNLSTTFNIKENDFIFLPIEGIKKMIDHFNQTNYSYLHVFIASYDAGPGVAEANKNKLTLLFSVGDDLSDPPLPYYTITPDGVFYQDFDSERWINHYLNMKLPLLNIQIDPKAPENSCQVLKTPSNTRKIAYDAEAIRDLMAEFEYQKGNGHSLTGLRAYFASYCFRGKKMDTTPHSPSMNTNTDSPTYVNRILLMFEFTIKAANGTTEVFYIDDQPDFKNRPTVFEGVDNGHLCPPC